MGSAPRWRNETPVFTPHSVLFSSHPPFDAFCCLLSIDTPRLGTHAARCNCRTQHAGERSRARTRSAASSWTDTAIIE